MLTLEKIVFSHITVCVAISLGASQYRYVHRNIAMCNFHNGNDVGRRDRILKVYTLNASPVSNLLVPTERAFTVVHESVCDIIMIQTT